MQVIYSSVDDIHAMNIFMRTRDGAIIYSQGKLSGSTLLINNASDELQMRERAVRE